MAERRALETRLAGLGRELDWPPTPDLARSVRVRLAPERPRRQWRWALAAAAALVLAVAGFLALSPGARETVAGWIGIRGVQVERVKKLPSVAPVPSGESGSRLGLGNATTLDRVEDRRLARVPSRLGRPDEVYQREVNGVPIVTLVYKPRSDLPVDPNTGVGALVVEMRGSVADFTIAKSLPPGTSVQPVQVRGTSGYWIAGSPHAFIILAGGAGDEVRLAGNVLLWTENGITYRIESHLSLQQTLAVAESMA
jgi:hypothetical protein